MRFIGLSGKQVVSALKRDGFVLISQKGSHIKLRKYESERKITTIVPDHKELKPGVVDSILELAEISSEEFKKLL